MSYLLITNCETCLKKGVCKDKKTFEDSIKIINQVVMDNSYNLGGSLKLDCNNFLELKIN